MPLLSYLAVVVHLILEGVHLAQQPDGLVLLALAAIAAGQLVVVEHEIRLQRHALLIAGDRVVQRGFRQRSEEPPGKELFYGVETADLIVPATQDMPGLVALWIITYRILCIPLDVP